MKKFLALLIMFSVCLAPVVGCGSGEKKDEKKTEEKKDAEKKDAEKKEGEKKDA